MCFYHDDGDWTASVWEDDTLTATAPVRCDECYRTIHPGERYRHIYQQEHEECRRCDEYGEHDDPADGHDLENPECKAGNHDVGETYEHDVCDRCQRLLDAIRKAEEDAGCKGTETQPAYGGLYEVERENWDEYTGRFARLGLLDEIALIPAPDWDDLWDGLAEEFDGAWCPWTPTDHRFAATAWDEFGGES